MLKRFALSISLIGLAVSLPFVLNVQADTNANIDPTNSNVNINGTIYFLSDMKMPCAVPVAQNAAANPCMSEIKSVYAYPSAQVFLSYGFNKFADVPKGNPADLSYYGENSSASIYTMSPANGSLVLYNGTIYSVWNGSRAAFTSADTFLGLGYKWNQVISADISGDYDTMSITSATQSHPPGTIINENGTLYYVDLTGKVGIPSPEIFKSWGFSWNKIVPANAQDQQLPMSARISVLNLRSPGQLNP